jgi:hypothetical protein
MHCMFSSSVCISLSSVSGGHVLCMGSTFCRPLFQKPPLLALFLAPMHMGSPAQLSRQPLGWSCCSCSQVLMTSVVGCGGLLHVVKVFLCVPSGFGRLCVPVSLWVLWLSCCAWLHPLMAACSSQVAVICGLCEGHLLAAVLVFGCWCCHVPAAIRVTLSWLLYLVWRSVGQQL